MLCVRPDWIGEGELSGKAAVATAWLIVALLACLQTFSMMGGNPHNPLEQTANAGLYVLAGKDIFATVAARSLHAVQVLVSCFEIYGGKLFDLLNARTPVKCLEDSKQQVRLPGLSSHPATSVHELIALMAKAHAQRSTGSTGANAESSRSHQVMQIVLTEAKKGGAKLSSKSGWVGGKLSFIDLAGSERGADTTHASKQTRLEGAEINTSLLALKEVIRSLEKKHGHTPFRGSKLTQVLKDSFVGDKSRCCMVACVSPSHSNCEHTLNTLRYADRVKEHSSSLPGDQGDAPISATRSATALGQSSAHEEAARLYGTPPSAPNAAEVQSLPKFGSPRQFSPETLSAAPSHGNLRALFPSKGKENLASASASAAQSK